MQSCAPEIVVLGGGACGMSAALVLVKLGQKVTVLEQEPRAGGLCGTVEQDGFRFDFGGHRFITADPHIDQMVRALVGEQLLERNRSSVILNQGQIFNYPLDLENLLRTFGLFQGAQAIASYVSEAIRPSWARAPDRSFQDWVTHRFGRQLYNRFFGPYTAKLWGLAPEMISADWAAQRISLLSLSDVLLRLLRLRSKPIRTYARRYLYPRLGIGQIFETCAREIRMRGGHIHYHAQVTDLRLEGQRIRSVRYQTPTGAHEIAAQTVISTISLPILAGLLGDPSDQVLISAARLKFRAVRLLNIMLRGPCLSPHTWMYVSEPQYVLSRIQEPIHRSPEMAPPGCTSLMLEIPCAVGDAMWRSSDQSLYQRCLQDLAQLKFPDISARTLGYFSTFIDHGYPIYHLGYAMDRRTVLEHISHFPNLFTCGRQGQFSYIFMDAAMRMGIAAARAAVYGHWDRPAQGAGQADLHEAYALTA